ncbi:IclR family transcriptional regulator [Roseomonas sp. SG15]|uniref:IclR family transcriptional regulator n=2 Tax=Roseomonas indoligenes TaxID=2820811 RepID=A0A940N7E7_9PROT|nr:IclR family transcriptional regulator [Pararoseomonas indoligenes]
MAPPQEAGGRQSVKSLLKMLDVLECFSTQDRELTVVEMARRTGMPRTTVHRIVDSLRVLGFLEQEASRERYRLGIKLFELGNTALTNLPLYREARPFVDTLSKMSGEVVHLCVFDGSQMVFVERSEHGSGRPHNTVTTMEATPCHSTGVGKATLAFQDEAVIDRIIRLGLHRFTSETITAPASLREELARIRARGFAVDECEHEPELRCVAAPIRNSTGKVFAAISVSGHTRRVTLNRVADLATLVMSHAQLISIRLGFMPSAASASTGPGASRPD